MIKSLSPNDITTLNPVEPADIIVGMNTELKELDSLHLPQRWQSEQSYPLPLGSVLSFRLDRKRLLHMLICHSLKQNGWVDADKYVRIGMDYLWRLHGINRDFSIVQIGAGRIGTAGGADVNKIRAAMAASFLSVTLFVKDSERPADFRTVKSGQLAKPIFWNPLKGLL
jgi:hypothetical protein